MAAKTIRQWFDECQDEELKAELLDNLDSFEADTRARSFSEAIDLAFVKADTEQGSTYWHGIVSLEQLKEEQRVQG